MALIFVTLYYLLLLRCHRSVKTAAEVKESSRTSNGSAGKTLAPPSIEFNDKEEALLRDASGGEIADSAGSDGITDNSVEVISG